MKWRLMALLWVGLVLSSTAQAQVWPAGGLWWQPGSNGKFMQLNIGPGGYALVTLSYSEGGQPTSRILQGQLESGAPALDGHFARLESPLYSVEDAGCLSCNDRDGRTVTDDPALHRLSFSSGTKASLLLPSGKVLRYELFPLITQLEETVAVRYASSELLIREGENSARAQPEIVAIPRDCEALLPAQATLLKLDFSDDLAGGNRLSSQLRSAMVAIEPGINPAVTLITQVPLNATSRCHGGGCPPPPRPCHIIATLSETSQGLGGDYTGTDVSASERIQVIALD